MLKRRSVVREMQSVLEIGPATQGSNTPKRRISRRHGRRREDVTPGSGLAMQMKRWVLVLARPPPSLAGIWAQGLVTFIPSGVPSCTGIRRQPVISHIPVFLRFPINLSTQTSYSAFPVYCVRNTAPEFLLSPSTQTAVCLVLKHGTWTSISQAVRISKHAEGRGELMSQNGKRTLQVSCDGETTRHARKTGRQGESQARRSRPVLGSWRWITGPCGRVCAHHQQPNLPESRFCTQSDRAVLFLRLPIPTPTRRF